MRWCECKSSPLWSPICFPFRFYLRIKNRKIYCRRKGFVARIERLFSPFTMLGNNDEQRRETNRLECGSIEGIRGGGAETMTSFEPLVPHVNTETKWTKRRKGQGAAAAAAEACCKSKSIFPPAPEALALNPSEIWPSEGNLLSSLLASFLSVKLYGWCNWFSRFLRWRLEQRMKCNERKSFKIFSSSHAPALDLNG